MGTLYRGLKFSQLVANRSSQFIKWISGVSVKLVLRMLSVVILEEHLPLDRFKAKVHKYKSIDSSCTLVSNKLLLETFKLRLSN